MKAPIVSIEYPVRYRLEVPIHAADYHFDRDLRLRLKANLTVAPQGYFA